MICGISFIAFSSLFFLYSLYHSRLTPNCYAIVWDIFSNHGIWSNHTMLSYLHIAYNHSIDSNVRTFSNGYFLTSLYNSLINHWNLYVAILMITIGYVHIGRKENFFSNFQRVSNRNSASLSNFGSLSNSYRTPQTRFGYRDVPLRNLPR